MDNKVTIKTFNVYFYYFLCIILQSLSFALALMSAYYYGEYLDLYAPVSVKLFFIKYDWLKNIGFGIVFAGIIMLFYYLMYILRKYFESKCEFIFENNKIIINSKKETLCIDQQEIVTIKCYKKTTLFPIQTVDPEYHRIYINTKNNVYKINIGIQKNVADITSFSMLTGNLTKYFSDFNIIDKNIFNKLFSKRKKVNI